MWAFVCPPQNSTRRRRPPFSSKPGLCDIATATPSSSPRPGGEPSAPSGKRQRPTGIHVAAGRVYRLPKAVGDMAARGNIQAPGMMKHGPFPSIGPAGHRPLEPLPLPELFENKIDVRAVEMEKLARENQRLAATHVILRQELMISQQEMQRLQSRVSDEKMESDVQIRGLSEKIAKLEADVRAGESLKRELQQAHLEAQSLVAARQELSTQIQEVTEELQKAHVDIKQIPELHADLDRLKQEHQRLRVIFEHEKGLNIEQVGQMHVMEKNMILMAREVEKLRADVLNAEKRAQAPGPYESTHGSANPAHPPAGQATNYPAAGYGQPVDGYSHASGYSNGVVGNPNYADVYGRAQVPAGGMGAEGAVPFGGVSSLSFSSYDILRGAPSSAQG